MTNVLLVDDEPAILRLAGAILERGGHRVLSAADARSALALLDRGAIDAAVVDLGLPDRDGLELVAAIRARGSIPVIVLSARQTTEDKIAALDLGADDYLTKPFDGDELLARLRSVLRRAGSAGEAVLEYGPLRIDRAQHRVTRDGAEVALTPREFDLLALLAEGGGRVFTHALILERIWGPAHRGDVEYLRVAIRALRLKLEVDPARPTLIRNEPGIGYRLSGS